MLEQIKIKIRLTRSLFKKTFDLEFLQTPKKVSDHTFLLLMNLELLLQSLDHFIQLLV